MKTLSLEELKKLSLQLFERNPELEYIYATSDGQLFLPHAKQSVKNHARIDGQDRPMTVHTILRSDVMEEIQKTKEEISIEQLLTKALEVDVVKKAGVFLKFGEVNLGKGIKKAIELLETNADLVTQIGNEIEKLNK